MASRHTSMASNSSIARKPSTKPKPVDLQGYVIDRPAPKFLSENLLGEEDEDEIEPATFGSVRPLQPQRQITTDGSSRLVIAIDYGTTFTGVAFAYARSDTAILDDVQIIQDWGGTGDNQGKIPSVISYSPSSEQQWGQITSRDAVTMVNTKMELDVQDNKIDELELILQLLHGTENLSIEAVKKSRGLPEYTYKTPEQIVTDYLTHIFKRVNQILDVSAAGGLKEKIQVDIVITVPVRWSYRAKNSTLRAVKQSGFNESTFLNLSDMILVTEPEAAALYTARHLKEDRNTEFLKLGECFVLCDAGGGTVDCVSYKVTQLEPLVLEEMSVATSAKCGSSFIDGNFKWWLRSLLGERYYRVLDPRSSGLRSPTSEGGNMRDVMRDFDAKKRAFASKPYSDRADLVIDMPVGPLQSHHIPKRLKDGELIVTHDEMKSFFDPCVDGVVELIQGQIQQVERSRNRVKNVFLVGGFAESQYLQDELTYSLDLRKIKMRKPEKFKAWTAVVQGAVLYGIEKNRHKKLCRMATCSRSYGVALNEVYSPIKYDKKDQYLDPVTNCEMAQQQITWLIRRGDLILSDEKKETEKEFLFHFKDTDERKFSLPVYEYPDDDDDVPERFATGENELVKAAILNCDLSTLPLTDFDRYQNPQTRRTFYIAYLMCKIILSGSSLEVEIHMKDKRICGTKIKDMDMETGGSRSSEVFDDSPWPLPSGSSNRGSQSSSSTSRTQKRIAKRIESMRMGSDPIINFDEDVSDSSPPPPQRRERPDPVVLSRVDLVSSPDPIAIRTSDPTPEPIFKLKRDTPDEPIFRMKSNTDREQYSPRPRDTDRDPYSPRTREITPEPGYMRQRERTPEPVFATKKEEPVVVKRKDTTLGRFRSVPDIFASGAYVAELPADEPVPKIPGGYLYD